MTNIVITHHTGSLGANGVHSIITVPLRTIELNSSCINHRQLASQTSRQCQDSWSLQPTRHPPLECLQPGEAISQKFTMHYTPEKCVSPILSQALTSSAGPHTTTVLPYCTLHMNMCENRDEYLQPAVQGPAQKCAKHIFVTTHCYYRFVLFRVDGSSFGSFRFD